MRGSCTIRGIEWVDHDASSAEIHWLLSDGTSEAAAKDALDELYEVGPTVGEGNPLRSCSADTSAS